MNPRRILIVDDDPDIRGILKENLELDGYHVCLASAGKEALLLFEQCEPAVIVLDLSLPDLDGIQVCRLIREQSIVPIIVVTARNRRIDMILAREVGADEYMVKPFDYMDLAAGTKACESR